ncbi:MAG: DUF1127 domain-containing protein [Pseudomonadota bacterium]
MNAMTQTLLHRERLHPGPIGHPAGATRIARTLKIIRQWSERATQRRHLARLTPEALEDIGISREAAAVEAAKPFWRP